MPNGNKGPAADDGQVPHSNVSSESVEQDPRAVNAPEIMTRTEAAQLLRISVSTLATLRDVPRHRVGATRRYLRSELLQYVKSRGAS